MSAPEIIEPPTSARRAVVVLGMHRSGTSAVAGCLQRMGVDFGPRLMPATADNLRGYYEHIDIVNLHDRLLLALGASWDETRLLPPEWWLDVAKVGEYREELLTHLRRDLASAPVWGIKDPRLCRLLPWWQSFWSAVNTRPLYLIVCRRATEVVASLARREGFSANKSYALWLLHTLEAERWTRGQPRVFIDFHDFLADWRKALEPVHRRLHDDLPNSLLPLETTKVPFIDAALSRSSALTVNTPLPPWIAQAEAALCFAGQPEEPNLWTVFDGLSVSMESAQFLYDAPDSERIVDLRHQLETIRRQARWYDAEWHKVLNRWHKLREKVTS